MMISLMANCFTWVKRRREPSKYVLTELIYIVTKNSVDVEILWSKM